MGRALDTPQAVIKQESMSPGPTSTPSETRTGVRNETWIYLIYKEVLNQSESSGGPSLHNWEKTGVLSALASSTIPRVRKEPRTFSIQDSLVEENLGLSIASCDV
jgi:hypothetical protein